MAFVEWDRPRVWLRAFGMALVLALGLYALSPGHAEVPTERPLTLRMTALPDPDGRLPRLGPDDRTLAVRAADPRPTQAELRFVLPPRTPESPQWVIWIPRVPLASVRLRVEDAWDSGERGFLDAGPDDGPMPVGYLFRLPSTWEGEIRLELAATALRDTAVRPELMSEALAEREMQQATIFITLAYASLTTVALLMLALFFASRDVSFLFLFAFCLAATLMLMTANGHLHALDPFGLFRRLGGAGIHMVSLVFEASGLAILLRYADTAQARPGLARGVRRGAAALLVLAVLIAAAGRMGALVAAWLMPAVWLLGCGVALWLVRDAWSRRVPFSPGMALAVIGIALTMMARELGAHALLPDSVWIRFGYQTAIVVAAATISVGLISRISKYREQRDREQRARADSERRMYREAVRTELLTALQMALRGVPEEEIQPLAMRLLLEHLRRIVPADRMLAILRGYHGRDTLAAQPGAALDALVERIVPRLPALRQQLAINIDVQQPVSRSGEAVPVAVEAAVSLPVRAPAWGALVLERAGATVFHPDELSIARELARIAVLQIDEAFTALHLRHTAEVDALTGALNRRSIDQALSRIFPQAHRQGLPLSVLYIDVDHFKSVNDRMGHAAGDHCLREIARLVGAGLVDEDQFGRYGGEEFLVVLPGRQTEMARAIAEQIRRAVEDAELRHEDRPLRTTVSIGVATMLAEDANPQQVVERADKALYAAKRGGRNRVSVAPAVFAPRPATA